MRQVDWLKISLRTALVLGSTRMSSCMSIRYSAESAPDPRKTKPEGAGSTASISTSATGRKSGSGGCAVAIGDPAGKGWIGDTNRNP